MRYNTWHRHGITIRHSRPTSGGHVYVMDSGVINAFVTVMVAPDLTFSYLADGNLSGDGFTSLQGALFDAADRFFHVGSANPATGRG